MTVLDTLLSAALAHYEAGRLPAAEACYREALGSAPGRASILHNLGVVVAALGRHDEALAIFDRTIAAQPAYGAAHYNRGVALQALGRTRDALAAFSRSAVLEPGHYDSHRALALLWLAQGDRDRALDHFARTYELRRGEDRDGSALASLTYASRRKLAHDAAQFRHLAETRRDGKRFELLARAYEAVARDLPDGLVRLDARQLDMLGDDYNTAIHISSALESAGGAVNPSLEARAAADAFAAGGTGAIWLDEVLRPRAFLALRRHLLQSTIWHDFAHIGGFVASYLEDGLACPLVLQIADELRRALPGILGPHPLSQAWAFKGLEGASTVAAHADDAAITVNLWLTPDAANLDPGGGGLRICRVPAPPEWQMSGYDTDMAEVAGFMHQHAAQTLVVPYAANRAAIFRSRLFHASDAPRFAPGYESHRINVTLLYGRASGPC